MPEKDSRRLYNRARLDLSKICTDFFLSFLLLVELSLLEFHPGPRLKSAEAGERLCTRQ